MIDLTAHRNNGTQNTHQSRTSLGDDLHGRKRPTLGNALAKTEIHMLGYERILLDVSFLIVCSVVLAVAIRS